jgi:hypothetical protein
MVGRAGLACGSAAMADVPVIARHAANPMTINDRFSMMQSPIWSA